MLNQLQSLTEYVGGNNALIDQWLQARKQLLVAYYHLVGIKPNKEALSLLDEEALDNFCQNLVDYLSTGHFHLYEKMLHEAATHSEQVLALSTQLDFALQNNTQQIMTFYDSHLAAAIDHDNCIEFQQALSSVGEALEERFTLEDNMIKQVYDN
ncbi:regulator of sigma D [Pectobacterium atrosepticum SCRI1043]|uniref:Regulator of sigma D n=1 Tax=Pectobacterium atrosepticum (strain SCRI 1043 / ATCC BAA-672) TaxID=218491 RepID=RSD_PECAS|nr:sigma D regulator [Pectobacterium atrosepticum]Q6DAL9.1 RecName: Full=Regulator of sigma D [Pectobacterium atrosepticum SCRI1043]GKV87998.1 regulator of sigma D [Pectobacterium carotovorum subsp. carotovorum]AIA69253.1 regulator of sigma D [Pectobacterium atrosepticum]AIK12159.1 regulator of sigma D [Pectobacterium atrosepticum]ATY89102.1 sigma D regulator [Pectobacterium atrosepticum]KFX10632.1 regulator of sigma D [Pectobacterium atrosepticum]